MFLMLFLLGLEKVAQFVVAICRTWWAWPSKSVLFTLLGERVFHIRCNLQYLVTWVLKVAATSIYNDFESWFLVNQYNHSKTLHKLSFQCVWIHPKLLISWLYVTNSMILLGPKNIQKNMTLRFSQWCWEVRKHVAIKS